MEHPQTSAATSFNYDIPIERQVRLVADTGFSHLSPGALPEHSGYLEAPRRRELKTRVADLGLAIDTIHARPLHHPKALEDAAATLFAAAELGASFAVAHVGPFNCGVHGLDERLTSTLAVCNGLVPVVKAAGVLVALENVMPGPATDLVRQALFDLDPAAFGLCYDSSHDQIDGSMPFDLIDEFSNRIFAVHLSDRIRPHVDHVIPGEGFIPWADMCQKLGVANYTGPILMEVLMTHPDFGLPTIFWRTRPHGKHGRQYEANKCASETSDSPRFGFFCTVND